MLFGETVVALTRYSRSISRAYLLRIRMLRGRPRLDVLRVNRTPLPHSPGVTHRTCRPLFADVADAAAHAIAAAMDGQAGPQDQEVLTSGAENP
jgi:hypothetical protein